MLHQSRSALTKAHEQPAIKPWYEIQCAADLLELCVQDPPQRHSASAKQAQDGLALFHYDLTDWRVKLLRAIHASYFEAFEQIDPALLPQTRFDIGVSEAIDRAIDAAEKAASTEALRDRLLAQGLTLGEVNDRMTGAGA